jgi:hypothetical protein
VQGKCKECTYTHLSIGAREDPCKVCIGPTLSQVLKSLKEMNAKSLWEDFPKIFKCQFFIGAQCVRRRPKSFEC